VKSQPRFRNQPASFWAYVRSISEATGYTDRVNRSIKIPAPAEIQAALGSLALDQHEIFSAGLQPTDLGARLLDYFTCRADTINRDVQPALMDARAAEAMFKRLRKTLSSRLPIAMNKQSGRKKKPAYLTAMVGMLIEAHRGDFACDFDPRSLTAFTRDGRPLQTLSRRVDGAFPSTVNPAAIWEIKEYYHTTTFGSRVADGVYETQLDGMELTELRRSAGVDVKHYLFLDAHYTWWECGRSYLCRIFDMVNMGLVDEVIVGRQIEARVPDLVAEWKTGLALRADRSSSRT
jgi:hypothetical protein